MRLDLSPGHTFQETLVPEETRLAGWAALVHALSLQAPARSPSCVSEKHVSGSQREEGMWRVFDKRYWPGDEFADHLIFDTGNVRAFSLLFSTYSCSTGTP